MNQKQGKKPVKQFSAGHVQAAIWDNATPEDGDAAPSYSTKVEKRYRDKKTDNWQSTNQYFAEDLADLALVAQKALEFVRLRERNGAPE